MGLFRLVYRIGRMVFRDFLFKIPKKYLVVIIVFLVFMFLKTNVFAATIENDITYHDNVPYTNVVAFYEYFNFWNSDAQKSITYDTNLLLFNEDTYELWIDATQNSDWNDSEGTYALWGFRSPIENGVMSVNYKNWGMVWFGYGYNAVQYAYYINNSNLSGNGWGSNPFDNNSCSCHFYHGTNGYGYCYNIPKNRTYSPNQALGLYLDDNHGYLSFNMGTAISINSSEYFRLSEFYTLNSSQEVTHDYYPVLAYGSDGVVHYGFYDTYTGNFDYFTSSSVNKFYVGEELTVAPENNVPVVFVSPFITTATADILDWSFENLTIDGGSLESFNEYGDCYFTLEQIYNDTTTYLNIDNYYAELQNGVVFSIPRNLLIPNNSIVDGRTLEFNLIYTKAVEGGRDIITYSLGTYTFGLSANEQENINNDRTQQSLDNIAQQQQQTTNAINNMNNNINNVTNSINNTNNFLQSNTMPSDNDISITSPTIENSEISGLSDGFFNNYMTTFADLFNSSDSVSIDIYIPNFVTGGGTRFITINSDIVKNHIQNLPVIPGTTFTVYGLIQVIWGALFGFWFVMIITGFVNSVYSGELMSDEGLKKLSSTYTNVTSNML